MSTRKPVFFSDLDATLVYSKRFLDEKTPSIVAENSETGPISYMTKNSRILLDEVTQKCMFIPVSTRSYELMHRIDFIKELKPEWVVCDNGLHIYHNGTLLEEWEYKLSILSKNLSIKVSDFEEPLHTLLDREGLKNIVNIENNYLVLKFKKMNDTIQKIFSNLTENFAKKGYYVAINSRKAYILPFYARKENALTFLVQKYTQDTTISAGDSLMDLGMLKKTNYSISPKHRTFVDDSILKTEDSGIVAGEEILTYAINLSNSLS